MPRVDFYIVAEPAPSYRFVCRLADKAQSEGYDMYIQAASRQEAAVLDDLLWTFRDTGFLPHLPADAADLEDCPVVIGWEGLPKLRRRMLINLCRDLPEPMDDYERIVEVTPPDPEHRQAARRRYQEYRARGMELHSHDLSANA